MCGRRGEPISDRTTTPTVKHGGGNNLMVWGGMGWNGVGNLIEVEGKMDAEQYCEILEEGLVESFETLEMEEGEHYFQQDNDPKHTSKKAKKWFEDNDIQVIFWPVQSPDLIPLNTFGNTSNASFINMKLHLRGCMNCGTGLVRSGMDSHQKHVRTS